MFADILSVTQITGYIKKVFSADPILNSVSIRGEISNFKHHYSGHMYFTLKDDNSKIKCVMFKNSNSSLKFFPEDGMSVIVSGNISLYERDGQYQLYVSDMLPDGKGALYTAFEQLKQKLQAEGLFDSNNKLPLPEYPKKVGVVTSSTGAAVRDIINVMTRRFPGVHIMITPVLVQGSEAAAEIAKAIELLNSRDDIDVIIVARGGGSIEELWAFNEEIVARAIYKSSIPIISGVGHETDFTIADFVADLRAPTPSAAGELCVPDQRELARKLESYFEWFYGTIKNKVDDKKNSLIQKMSSLNSLNPTYQLNQKRQYVDSLNFKLTSLFSHQLDIKKEIIKKHSASLNNLSPLSILARGYSIAYEGGTKNLLDDVRKAKCGENIDVVVKNGTIECVVKRVLEEESDVEV